MRTTFRTTWRWWSLGALPLLDAVTAKGLATWVDMAWPPIHPALTFPQWLHGAMAFVSWDRAELARATLPFVVVQVFYALVAYISVRAALRAPYEGSLRAARQATHGSSRWRHSGELAGTLSRFPTNRPDDAGIVVGSDSKSAWRTRADVGNPHTLVIGGTRSGKTRRVILPTVWTLGHAGHSMVLSDPKGELYDMTATWLREQGYEVAQLDLLRPSRGNRWNPFAAITAAHEEGDEEKASALALEFGHILAYPDVGAATDPIWPQSSESLITALALATAYEAPPEARHPATAYHLLREFGDDGGKALDAYFNGDPAEWAFAYNLSLKGFGPDPGPRPLPPSHPARAAYGVASMSESRTRSSIYTGTAAALRLFADPGVAWLTAASDHDPAEAATRKTALFLLVPDEVRARRPILALYITQAYAAMAEAARKNGGVTPVPIWFLLDEFGNVGKVPSMTEKLTVSAGRGIRFLLALQSLAQISQVYGKDDLEVITGNCDSTIFLRCNDEATARAISAKAGTFTVQTLSRSSRGLGGADTSSESATGRPLLTPDEVLRWELGNSLLLQAGQYPARLPLADLSAWKAAYAAFQPRPPAAETAATAVPLWLPTSPEPPLHSPDHEDGALPTPGEAPVGAMPPVTPPALPLDPGPTRAWDFSGGP